ncbi:beta-ketoacyl synthase chain length factor [bacterium]|nr:beta-ketoacyl synthase chain length factor [bacterium]
MDFSRVLIGAGSCSPLRFEQNGPVNLNDLATLQEIPRALRRKMGRLSQLMYVAVFEAIRGLDLPQDFPLVVGTAYGEIDQGIDALKDIHESGGSLLRPVNVQNSVHVSSSGYLGILLQNHGPTLTISQGKLTAEASLDALITLMEGYQSPVGVMVVGDLFNPDWSRYLQDRAPKHHALLTQTTYYEGAVALVLADNNEKDGPDSHWLLSGHVARHPVDSPEFVTGLKEIMAGLPSGTPLIGRFVAPCQDSVIISPPVIDNVSLQYFQEGPGWGTSMTGPLEHMLQLMNQANWPALVFIGRDDEECGFIECRRRESNH